MRIAHVSTFPPMKCGIAFYVSDLIGAVPAAEHVKYVLHYGGGPGGRVAGDADVSKPSELQALARAISSSDCDVVSLQHEFGIWGGQHGEHILGFLDALRKPVVTTLHTTFETGRRPEIQRSILDRLVRESKITLVLTPQSRDTLCRTLAIEPRTVSVVPHGVPDIDFKSPPPTWSRTSKRPRTLKLCSVGFFRPDKGIETVVRAVQALRDARFPVEYVIAGEPQRQFAGQAEYLHEIQNLVTELGVDDCIRIEARFLTRDEQVEVIQNAHAGVFAYQDEGQASSGAVPLVLASGRPVVCTPFEFVVAKRRELGRPVWLATNFTPQALGSALLQLIGSGASYRRDCRALHARIKPWSWSHAGATYAAAFEACHRRVVAAN